MLWRTTLRLNPKAWLAHHNLGVELDHQGRATEAIEQFQQALELEPDYLDARFNLGTVYFQMGRINEARTNYQKVVDIQPRLAAAHQNLARCYFLQGQMREAISENEKAIEIQPDYPEAQKNLAWVLATSPEDELRNGARAVELAERANQRTGGGNPQFLCVLAAARAEVGRFAEAAEMAQMALRMAEAQSNATLARQLGAQLELYQMGKPYRRAAH
jgi:tetratricopeptide (TPR) repeat protein